MPGASGPGVEAYLESMSPILLVVDDRTMLLVERSCD